MTAPVITKRIKLRGAAKELLSRREPEVLLAGPAGTGKSFAALYKLHLMCMLNPGMRALAVRKTHKSLTATGLVTFREQVAKEAIEAGICRWYGGSGEKPAQYIYSNGSVLLVGGLDNADKIMSLEIDIAYVQEATDLTPQDWELITTRLRNGKVSFQQIIADCNPQQPRHWLKMRCDEGKTVMLYGRHEDNPRLFDDAGRITEGGRSYLSVLDSLSGVRKDRLRWGKWAAAEGLVYEGWNPAVHLVDRKILPRAWRRLWAIDFGYTNPFVWQMWAVDPDGRLWLEKEIYRTGRIVEDHVKAIMSVVMNKPAYTNWEKAGFTGAVRDVEFNWKYPYPDAVICDHDAEDRATFERHAEMGTVAAWKSVSDGVQAVQSRLKVAGDGQPRMYVCRDALVERDELLVPTGKPLWFGDEIEGYVWNPAKDAPVKENDHSMDTTRYVVAYEDLAAKPRVRWL